MLKIAERNNFATRSKVYKLALLSITLNSWCRSIHRSASTNLFLTKSNCFPQILFNGFRSDFFAMFAKVIADCSYSCFLTWVYDPEAN